MLPTNTVIIIACVGGAGFLSLSLLLFLVIYYFCWPAHSQPRRDETEKGTPYHPTRRDRSHVVPPSRSITPPTPPRPQQRLYLDDPITRTMPREWGLARDMSVKSRAPSVGSPDGSRKPLRNVRHPLHPMPEATQQHVLRAPHTQHTPSNASNRLSADSQSVYSESIYSVASALPQSQPHSSIASALTRPPPAGHLPPIPGSPAFPDSQARPSSEFFRDSMQPTYRTVSSSLTHVQRTPSHFPRARPTRRPEDGDSVAQKQVGPSSQAQSISAPRPLLLRNAYDPSGDSRPISGVLRSPIARSWTTEESRVDPSQHRRTLSPPTNAESTPFNF